MKDSFYQIVLHKDSRHLTAFEFNDRSYAFARIPMGMSVSAGVLVKVVNKILEPLSDVNVLAYLDDILIMSPDEDTFETSTEFFWHSNKPIYYLTPRNAISPHHKPNS